MSLSNAAIMVDSTGISATGGSSESLITVQDGLGRRDMYFGDAGYLARHNVSFTAKEPKVSPSSPSGYTQARKAVVLRVPKVLANEALTYITLRIEAATDVESTDAEIEELIYNGAQLLGDTDFQNFWVSGSMG